MSLISAHKNNVFPKKTNEKANSFPHLVTHHNEGCQVDQSAPKEKAFYCVSSLSFSLNPSSHPANK